MLTYSIRRVAYSVPVLLIASFLLFAFVRTTFDPTARLAGSRDPQVRIREQQRLGLDDPLVTQYGRWLKGAVHADFGKSEISREDVSKTIRRGMTNTLQLILIGAVISCALALAIGVYSATRQYSTLDYVFTGMSYIGVAMPPFWFGLIAIQFFAVRHHWLYSLGLHSGDQTGVNLDYIRHLPLPIATLCVQIIASWSRYERASMLDALNADYVRTARAKGLPRRTVVLKHALRNALIPFVTVVALDFGALFGGLIITESIFSIGGMGRVFFSAIQQGDAYVLEAWMLVAAVIIIFFNLVADLLYGVLDPADPVVVIEQMELTAEVEAEPRSQWQLFRRRFFRHRVAVVSVVVLIALLVVCFGAHWIAPYPRGKQDLLLGPQGPSGKHWLGTDNLGTDQLTTLLYAGQVSLKIGLAVALISTLIGTVIGAIAGYFGKAADQLLMRATDLFLIVPSIAVLAIALKRFGHTVNWIIIVLAALGWMYVARIVRGQVLSIKEKEFVEAARASGASSFRVIVRHILPNCIGPILVNATLAIAGAIITESTLSFLGFGIQIPQESWGHMLSSAEGNYAINTHLLYFPGIMILLTVLCVNFLGDGLRDAFDPQSAH